MIVQLLQSRCRGPSHGRIKPHKAHNTTCIGLHPTSNHHASSPNTSTSSQVMSPADMAPSAAANSVDQDDSSDKYDRAKALYFAKVQEGGGSVLKDYYTAHEYRFRRADFIGNLPDYSQPANARWNASKLDADIIFDHELQQLDVQEVRERELAAEFDVLLPLPTTANTQSIDNFKTCPPIDGSRMSDEDQEAMDDGRDVPTPGGSSPHSTPGTSHLHDVPRDEQILRQTAMPEKTHDHPDISDLPITDLPDGVPPVRLVIKKPVLRQQTPKPHSGLADQDLSSVGPPHGILGNKPGPHMTKRVTFSIETEDPTQPNDNRVVLGSLENATNVQQAMDATKPITPTALRPAIEHLTSNGPQLGASTLSLATQKLGSSSPKTFTPHPEISSMARYGLSPPVKGKKRHHSPEINLENPEEVSSNPQLVTSAVSKPASSPKASISSPETESAVRQPDNLEPVSNPKTSTFPPNAEATAGQSGIPKPAPNSKVSITNPNADQTVFQPDTPKPAADPEVSTSIPNADNSSSQPDIVKRASKRLKKNSGVPKPVQTPVTSTILNVAEDDTSLTTAVPNPPTADTRPSPVAAPDQVQRRLEGIISGKIRPRSKREAKEAADELHGRLLARHNAVQGEKKGRRTSRQSIKDADPDFMPHYFSKVNFPASEKDGTTRCICGATENVDTNQAMFACETCGVWQHFSCVYPELHADGKDGKDLETLKMSFLCSVCDPWGHREVLQQLRQRAPIGD